MDEFIITGELMKRLINNPSTVTRYEIGKDARPLSEHDSEQCHTCKLKDKRSCIYHGYPAVTIPHACSYKLGIDCERSLHNLNGTHIDVWTKEHDAEIGLQAYQNGYDRGRTDQQMEDEDNHKTFLITHDAEIAKKATDKLIDEFKWMKPLCFGKQNSPECDTRCKWVVRTRCIESLRGEP